MADPIKELEELMNPDLANIRKIWPGAELIAVIQKPAKIKK